MKKIVNILNLQSLKRESTKDDKQVAFKFQIIEEDGLTKSPIYLGFLTVPNILIKHWKISESHDLLQIAYLEIKNQLSYIIKSGNDLKNIDITFSLNNPHLNKEYLEINDVREPFQVE